MRGELRTLPQDIPETGIEFGVTRRRYNSISYEEKKLAVECTKGNEFMRKYAEMFPGNNDVGRMSTIWGSRSKYVKEAADIAKAKIAAEESKEQNGKIVLRNMEPQVQNTPGLETGSHIEELVNQNEIIAGTLSEILDVLTELLELAKKE